MPERGEKSLSLPRYNVIMDMYQVMAGDIKQHCRNFKDSCWLNYEYVAKSEKANGKEGISALVPQRTPHCLSCVFPSSCLLIAETELLILTSNSPMILKTLVPLFSHKAAGREQAHGEEKIRAWFCTYSVLSAISLLGACPAAVSIEATTSKAYSSG